LRDLAGAAHPIWTPASRIARSLAIPEARLIEMLTTTADHRPAPPQKHPTIAANLPALREAVAAALRVADTDGGRARRLIVQAAHAITLPGVRRLADELGCSPRTVFRDRAARDSALEAVLLCLGDARLRADAKAAVPSDPTAVGRHGWQTSRLG
jgi:hypothetical protein